MTGHRKSELPTAYPRLSRVIEAPKKSLGRWRALPSFSLTGVDSELFECLSYPTEHFESLE